jgi:hypothetical protein
MYRVCTKSELFLLFLLMFTPLFAGCISQSAGDTGSQTLTTPLQINGVPVSTNITPVIHQEETSNATAGPEGEFSQSLYGLTKNELLLIPQRSPVYLAHPNEIPVLFDTNGSPEWTGADKIKLIEIALKDPRVRENIDNGGMIIGVSFCIHPTPKGSDSMGGPALRILNNGTVTDYIVNEDTGEVNFLCIGPVEQVPEFRQRQLNLDMNV